MSIEARFRTLVANHVGLNEEKVVSEATFFDDLGCDSLDMVEITMEAEEEFNIEIPDDDVERLSTFGEAVKMLEERSNGA